MVQRFCVPTARQRPPCPAPVHLPSASRGQPHSASSGSLVVVLVQRMMLLASSISRMASQVTSSWLIPQYSALAAPEALIAVIFITDVLSYGCSHPLVTAS